MLEETRPDGHGRAKGLVSSRESGRRVDARTFAPSAALRGVVEAYWVTRWDLHDQPPHVAELLTDPCVSVVLEAGQSRVVGVSTRLFRRELRERGLMRAVKLRAGAARALLGDVPLVSLSDRRVPFAELLGAAPEALEAQVLGEADDTRALAALEAWLHARLRRPLDPKVTLAAGLVERATREPELRTVDALARAGGLTVRPLQRLFRDYVGASPKWVLRRERLRTAALRLEQGLTVSLAELAAELGYADHAHLTRDFRAATGRAPTDFARVVWR
jgi:AraC-like DNA-binding protein